MDHITIPIPDGMDERQKADITGWLTDLVEDLLPKRLPCEDDPQWQAEVARRIKLGMEDIKAGRCLPAKESLRKIADEFGLKLDR